MSGYLQRLFDRAAAPAPEVTVAGRLGAPMAEADQRLMAPEIEAADLPPGDWDGGPVAPEEGDIFERPVSPAPVPPVERRPAAMVPDAPRAAAAPPAPEVEVSRAGPAPTAPESAAGTRVLPAVPAPPEPEPDAPGTVEAPAPESIATTPLDRRHLPEDGRGKAPSDPLPPGPEVHAVVPPMALEQPKAVPAPILRETVREVPAPAPAPLPAQETVVEIREPVSERPEIPVAEPVPPRPVAEPLPEPEQIHDLARERIERETRERVVERTTEILRTEGGSESRPATDRRNDPGRAPDAPMTAASASVIGPLPDHLRAPMIRGRRRR